MLKFVKIMVGCLLLCGCRPYHVTIEQGNILEAREIAELRLGMSKEAVKQSLGNPVLQNLVDQNTLLYIYTKRADNEPAKYQQLKLKFIKNRLVEIK